MKNLLKNSPYNHPSAPRYVKQISKKIPHHSQDAITILSYNIKRALKIDQAIKTLREHNMQQADVICLQEMDLPGVKSIAQTLDYQYVYYPASVHRGKDFGNAILCRAPIKWDQKIILPHRNTDRTHRVAVAAELTINNKTILVFSIHLGVTIGRQQRFNQIQTILNSISSQHKHVIIAGDFNTIIPSHRKTIHKPLQDRNFRLASKNVQWTYAHWYLFNKKAELDYIFAYGLIPMKSGKIIDLSGSDHLPIWVELSFCT